MIETKQANLFPVEPFMSSPFFCSLDSLLLPTGAIMVEGPGTFVNPNIGTNAPTSLISHLPSATLCED